MKVVLCPPLAHRPAGHTECQTLPFLCAPPTCVHPQCATPGDTAQPGHQKDLSEGEVRFGAAFPAFPFPSPGCLSAPLQQQCLRGHTASCHSRNRITELWSTGVN